MAKNQPIWVPNVPFGGIFPWAGHYFQTIFRSWKDLTEIFEILRPFLYIKAAKNTQVAIFPQTWICKKVQLHTCCEFQEDQQLFCSSQAGPPDSKSMKSGKTSISETDMSVWKLTTVIDWCDVRMYNYNRLSGWKKLPEIMIPPSLCGPSQGLQRLLQKPRHQLWLQPSIQPFADHRPHGKENRSDSDKNLVLTGSEK